jgi:hypothetical protein
VRERRGEEGGEDKRKRDEPSGASSLNLKNWPRTLLSITPLTVGLLSASTGAGTSERRISSWRSDVHV